MPEYFRCEPGTLCEGAACCKRIDTTPGLGIGDYLRLSEATGEPAADIWRSKGDVHLTHYKNMPQGEFLVTLSLLHDPCPYLSAGNSCTVHESRPLACASFPLFLYMFRQEHMDGHYREYKCLKGVVSSPEQIQLGHALHGITMDEARIENTLWKVARYVCAPDFGVVFSAMEKARKMQAQRDPASTSPRSRRLAKSIHDIHSLYEAGEHRKGIDADMFSSMISPIAFALFQDEVAQMLEDLGNGAELYADTTKRWRELAEKIK